MAATYEQLLVARLREIAEERDPRLLFRRLQHQLVVGPFEVAELEETHAAMMAALTPIAISAWLDPDDRPWNDDVAVAERMALVVRRVALALDVSRERQGDDPVVLHPIAPPIPPGTYGWQDGEEPEILPSGEVE